jgi:hypothetical protein
MHPSGNARALDSAEPLRNVQLFQLAVPAEKAGKSWYDTAK